jgi:hypothetical protein
MTNQQLSKLFNQYQMKRKISIPGLIGALTVAAFLGGQAAKMWGHAAGVAVTLLFALMPFVKKASASNVSVAAIQVEIWQNHIEKNLFKNNEFLLASVDASQYVLQGKVVHIPQAGSTPSVVKNRAFTGSPITVTQRTDTDVTYSLDEYTTDPIQIPNADKAELSYDKRESVLGEHEATLRQVTADVMLTYWAPSAAASILRTTGENIETHLTGTTGSRLKFTTKDLKKAQNTLNKQNVPMEERYALMSADMYDQFTDSMTDSQYRDFSKAFDEKTGICGQLFGFKIMMRSSVVTYDNTATPVLNAYGAAAAAADNDGVLCWQKNAVERAVGTIQFFQDEGSPVYFGDVYSLLTRMGGRKRRDDQKGIIAIVQAPAAGV